MTRTLVVLGLALAIGAAGCSSWGKKERKPVPHTFTPVRSSSPPASRGPEPTSPPR